MDCNSGAQLGWQFNKDVTMFQGNTQQNPTISDTDNLMQMPIMHPAMIHPTAGAEWAQAFHNSRNAGIARHTNEMEQAFLASQQTSVAPMAVIAGGPHTMNQQQHHMAMMSGMMGANMGSGLMLPRTQYQTTPLNLTQTQQQEVSTAQNTNILPQEDWTTQLAQQQWAQDYANVENFTLENQTAESVEEKTKNSEFYSFMDRIRNREVLIDEEKGELVSGPGPEPVVMEDMEYLKTWCKDENINMPDEVFHPTQMDGFGPAIDATQEVDDWAREYMKNQKYAEEAANSTDYPFEPNNPYVHHDNPYEDGLQMLQLGNLAEAALAFEAECQRHHSHFEAWRILGTTQANNEKDALAIVALNNARRINPRDREVHAALSVSHTNEHNSDAAIDCLKQWLLNHPEYEQLAQIPIEPDQVGDFDTNDTYFFSDPIKMREVVTLYHAALELNPNDADLYTNLGIIYNISHDFDLAAKNFHRTVELRPNDAKVWNKLGATLANGSHSEQALEAYQHALDVDPGYVRAMFNMAVAYNNVGKYLLAAKHVVRALAMQQGGTEPKGEGNLIATRGMWDLLRMSLNLMDRHDLVDLTYKMDLAPFIRELDLEGMV
ncbi:unnamed protein product [Phytomonas sp. Hart1]|nr:unnamed protein product [Phytomonas sp. Hart1]|eukprot:CCW71957.1 unnamed protein product [Phytomonas sp. isolate Hart1]